MIFVYYVLLSAGQALAEQEIVPAVVGLWMPNVVFAVLGVYLFGLAARERSVTQLERVQAWLTAIRDRILGRLGHEAPS
jgi:hypothetical protein